MIRVSRACIFGKYNWNIPVAQRVMSPPNRLPKLVEFSVFANKKENSPISELKERILEKDFKGSPTFQNSYQEIKNTFVRDVLEGGFRSNSTPNYDALKNFFDTLPSYPPPEIIKILKLLVETKNRPIESIKNLCSLLCTHSNWDYTLMDCSDLLFSLARLSYRDDLLINIICKHLKNLEKPIMDSMASKILFSLGELRYKDPNLIGKLIESVLCHPISLQYSLSCLKAVSNLNYACPKVENLIKLLSNFQEVDFIRSQDYLDFIWTCVILNKTNLISLEHISRVLSLSFVSRTLSQDPVGWNDGFVQAEYFTRLEVLTSDEGGLHIYLHVINMAAKKNQQPITKITGCSQQHIIMRPLMWDHKPVQNPLKWKLLNVNAAARNIPSYKGPFVNDYPQFKVLNMSVREKTSTFLDSVHDTLTYIVPQTGYIKCRVNTGAGFNLDLEYRMTSDSKSDKSSYRTGLLLLNYKDICSDGTMAGIPQFKLNILESMNYKISTLKYSDFNPSEPLSKKISLIRNKIEKQDKWYLPAFWIKHEA